MNNYRQNTNHKIFIIFIFIFVFTFLSINLYSQLTCNTSFTNPASGTETYTYNSFGQVTSITNSISSVTTSFNYNTANQLISREERNAGGTIVGSSTYNNVLDANGYPTGGSFTGLFGVSGTFTSSFSNTGNLISIVTTVTTGPPGVTGNTTNYIYDSNNKLIRREVIIPGVIGTPPTIYDGNCDGIKITLPISTVTPIPTMSQWGLLIYCLLVVNFALLLIKKNWILIAISPDLKNNKGIQ